MKIKRKYLIELINEVLELSPSTGDHDAVKRSVYQILESKKITYVTDDPMQNRSNLAKHSEAFYIATVPLQQLRKKLYLRPAAMTIFSDVIEKFASFLRPKFSRAMSSVFSGQMRGQPGDKLPVFRLLIEGLYPEGAGDFGELLEGNMIRIVAMPYTFDLDQEDLRDNYHNAAQEENVYTVDFEGLA